MLFFLASELTCFTCATQDTEEHHSNCLAPTPDTVSVVTCSGELAGHTPHCGALKATVSNAIAGNQGTYDTSCTLGRSFSFPGSTPACPRYIRIALIPGAHPGRPPVLCLWSGSLRGDPRCMTSQGECDRSISAWQGLTRMSTAGLTQGS